MRRYRRQWTKPELEEFLQENGYETLLFFRNEQPNVNKKWMDFVVTPKST